MTGKAALLIACAVAAIVAVFIFVPPLHQDLAYHQFADQRTWAGIPRAAVVAFIRDAGRTNPSPSP